MYTLKPGQPAFQVVDGPCKGRTYKPGEVYAEVPPQDAGRFKAVKAPAPGEEPREATKRRGRNAPAGDGSES